MLSLGADFVLNGFSNFSNELFKSSNVDLVYFSIGKIPSKNSSLLRRASESRSNLLIIEIISFLEPITPHFSRNRFNDVLSINLRLLSSSYE